MGVPGDPIEGVPVVNASILQEIPLINLNPNVIMMAEKLAAQIRAGYEIITTIALNRYSGC